MGDVMNDTLETMWKRRSNRKYRQDLIPDADLYQILEAARRAPTGSNRQKWRLIVITDGETKRKTAEACNNQMWMADAPVILCVVAEPGEGTTNAAIVLDHAILAATSMGYGTCWIGAYSEDQVKGVLGIPEDYTLINLTPLGLAADDPDARGRKEPGELFMSQRFGSPLSYSL